MSIRDDILTKEAKIGRAALSPEEREIYFFYRTICELEIGGLFGLLYNISPDWNYLTELSAHLRQRGELDLARLFDEAEAICRSEPSDFRGTWSGWLALVDPQNRLERLADDIAADQARLWDRLENEN